MTQPARRLVRSKHRVIAGVCGGIAEKLGWPANRVRVIYVLISVLSAAFPGILAYIVLWFLMPAPSE
ncbi:MAG: PspC domain-containing protein [Candidatus Krumholzibacteria bacterium]|nr:PspC domain-containing protein [Candidatus Krumholzibacteria bacterium]